jgi:hypothetical protein
VDTVRLLDPRRVLGAISMFVLLGASACAGGGPGPVLPSLSPTPPPSAATPHVTIPADGVSLQTLGYRNGPVEQFSLPRSSVITATVDQANNVTAVLVSPPAAEVAAYLRRTLPMSGFTVLKDDSKALTMTFTGYGWTGSFTGNETTSAVLLRPQ